MPLNLSWDATNEHIARALAVLDNRRYVVRALVPAGYESYFREQARYISAHTSTAIEGNPLDENAAMVVLVEGADQDDPAQLEKVNLEEAYELMASLAVDKTLRLDQGIIRTFNSIALKGLPDSQARNRGRYRVSQNLIVDSSTREVRYRPPAPEDVPNLMSEYVDNLNIWTAALPAPLASALAHFGLISIHPFDDGNGRTARLVADMILEIKGWSIEGMLSISPVLFDRRAEYYAALRETQGEVFKEAVDVTPFMRFHSDALVAAAENLEAKVVQFNKRRDTWIGQYDWLNQRQVTALMFLVDLGRPLSSSVYARLTKTSQPTAISDLGRLVHLGVVRREGAGRNTRYRIPADVLRLLNA